jgi:hypothetical protein
VIECGQTWIFRIGHDEAVYLVLEVDPRDIKYAIIRVLDLTTGRVCPFWKESFVALAASNGTVYL